MSIKLGIALWAFGLLALLALLWLGKARSSGADRQGARFAFVLAVVAFVGATSTGFAWYRHLTAPTPTRHASIARVAPVRPQVTGTLLKPLPYRQLGRQRIRTLEV